MDVIIGTPSGEDFVFTGTKRKIFDRSLELFTEFGFENVSIKDIADAVGIMQSSIYNHFPSKRSILDTMYGYFVAHFTDNMTPPEKAKEILLKGTREEFFSALLFTFESEDVDKDKRMIMLIKLVYMRLFQDEGALELFSRVLYKDLTGYITEILDYGVSVGVLAPFDTLTFAEIVAGQRYVVGVKAYTGDDYRSTRSSDEARIMKMLMGVLPYTDGR